jgi:hypothetical protein
MGPPESFEHFVAVRVVHGAQINSRFVPLILSFEIPQSSSIALHYFADAVTDSFKQMIPAGEPVRAGTEATRAGREWDGVIEMDRLVRNPRTFTLN